MLKRFSIFVGLTETEIKVLLFLLLTLTGGFCYKTFFKQNDEDVLREFDYSLEDSLFYASGGEIGQEEESSESNKSVDYKHEVLDFNESNFSRSNATETPALKSINLNSAKLEELILLPGVGKRTAERIIEFRNTKGKFNSLNELLQVKGIGEVKFQNLRKYLFVE